MTRMSMTGLLKSLPSFINRPGGNIDASDISREGLLLDRHSSDGPQNGVAVEAYLQTSDAGLDDPADEPAQPLTPQQVRAQRYFLRLSNDSKLHFFYVFSSFQRLNFIKIVVISI